MAIQTFATGDNAAFNDMLPVDPFRSLYVHFGMLLGVDDFRTLDAYHRGKMWYHSAWLHGQGVIWGLGVELERAPVPPEGEDEAAEGEPTGEIRVFPGAALDSLGRELYLSQAACLNLGAWYAAHEDDAALIDVATVDPDTGEVVFDAHVTIEFEGCLDRQVPALTEPCDGASSTTAYSRVVETVRLCLHPGKAPDWRANGALPFHRVRLLLGADQPLPAAPEEPAVPSEQDQAVLDARAAILAAPAEDRTAECLRWLRHFAVLDEMDLTPLQPEPGGPFNLFPKPEPAPVYLADVCEVRLQPDGDTWRVLGATIDNFVRPVHLPTSTIQELLCGPCCGDMESGDGDVPPGDDENPDSPGETEATISLDAGGPRIDAETVVLDGKAIRFTVVGGLLMQASVATDGVHVGTFNTQRGWASSQIESVDYDRNNGQVEVTLAQRPRGNPIRIIVSGTGKTPFLGRNRVPLAGAVGGPPGGANDGNDFVFMFRGS